MTVFTILLTAASGPLVPQAIRFLKDSKRHTVRVIAVDMSPRGAALQFADHFLKVPAGGDPGYVDAMAAIVEEHGVDLVVPWSDEEALALSEAEETITRRGAALACAPVDLLRAMSNKNETYDRLSKLGLPIARWVEATEPADIESAVRTLVSETGGAAVKPARSRGGRDIFVVRDDISGARSVNEGRETHLDLDTFLKAHLDIAAKLAPVIVMERLFEPVYDIDVLSWKGEALRVVPRRRHNPGGMPFTGNDIVPDPELIDLGQRTAAAIRLSWLYDFDVMTDRAGKPAVIEINPRPSGSMPVSIAAGVPILDDLISLAKGEILPEIEPLRALTVLPYQGLAVAGAQSPAQSSEFRGLEI
ncbi:MAG TPA: ATP-grasp domain-containing protein [Methyloceanibacter sp.]|nr:ATP-grasp domain-containing protein [Methyloceanibacter sp.]